MIHAVYHRTYHRLTVEGHAYSGEAGHDLVCASASVLAYTLADRVRHLTAAKQAYEPKLDLTEGKAEIMCTPRTRHKAAVTLIFDTVCAGFELLAVNFPQNISFEIRH